VGTIGCRAELAAGWTWEGISGGLLGQVGQACDHRRSVTLPKGFPQWHRFVRAIVARTNKAAVGVAAGTSIAGRAGNPSRPALRGGPATLPDQHCRAGRQPFPTSIAGRAGNAPDDSGDGERAAHRVRKYLLHD
jgi:hypothetical protein